MTMDDAIDIKKWRNTPHVSGRAANDADVNAGRAVFAVGGSRSSWTSLRTRS